MASTNKLDVFKKVAFTEAFLQRYYLERLYLSSSIEEKKSLLPPSYRDRALKLNLIFPEQVNAMDGYRPDFMLYFKGETRGVPIEMKVRVNKPSDIPKHQLDQLQKHKGCLVTLELNPELKELDIETVQIDLHAFKEWFGRNYPRLIDTWCAYRGVNAGRQPQRWIVLLRGTSIQNFHRMMNDTGSDTNASERFWAFSNNHPSVTMDGMVRMQKGDRMIFLLGHVPGGSQNLDYKRTKKDTLTPLKLLEMHEVEITKPYYVNPSNTYFESLRDDPAYEKHIESGGSVETLPMNNRKWPHFFDFKTVRRYELKNAELDRMAMTSNLTYKLSQSVRAGSVLIEMTSREYEYIIGEVRLLERYQNEQG